jgi:hypothetical protein
MQVESLFKWFMVLLDLSEFCWIFQYFPCVCCLRSHDEWELLDRPQLAPQLPQPLKERFGAPEEALKKKRYHEIS